MVAEEKILESKINKQKLTSTLEKIKIDLLGKIKIPEKIKKEIGDFFKSDQLWSYTEVTLTILLILFFIVFAIRPTVLAISSLLGEIRSREILSRQMGEKIEALVAAQNSYFLAEQKIGLLDDFYPEKINIAQGAAQIIGLALSYNIEITSMNFSQITFPNQTEEVGFISFDFAGLSSYQNTKQFLTSLFSVRRMIKIESYTLKPKVEGDKVDPEKININIKGKLGFAVSEKKRN